MQKEDYDKEPVYYCKRCLSLNIRQIPMVDNQFCCGDCGTVDLGTASIEEWEEMYNKKYGHNFIVKKELKWPYWC